MHYLGKQTESTMEIELLKKQGNHEDLIKENEVKLLDIYLYSYVIKSYVCVKYIYVATYILIYFYILLCMLCVLAYMHG